MKTPHEEHQIGNCPLLCKYRDVWQNLIKEGIVYPNVLYTCIEDKTLEEGRFMWVEYFNSPVPITATIVGVQARIQTVLDEINSIPLSKAFGIPIKLEGSVLSGEHLQIYFSCKCPFFHLREILKKEKFDSGQFFPTDFLPSIFWLTRFEELSQPELIATFLDVMKWFLMIKIKEMEPFKGWEHYV